eukprot:CAMPEP_0176340624 /NCGR_PEP_ID=MMETSP0126-20121128/1712_1 /TAXON_ID=141414 ORGANISM="Strombidinopsis acuminatum, Strain SPMC142" /NCGR_SAMPLE_ID=MMETSP0126 /ASSEMBLY_ACC=CAM_ASM_000229 /LENGTH=57 /DNA_ID=CAMNT_0017684923 /DNA_START=139 /DNA_END=312 /DNA_ORIENTATION=-
MKLASLMIKIVKLLSKSIERIGDLEDEDEAPNDTLKVYLESPLLLEQYEAQIYSVIR